MLSVMMFSDIYSPLLTLIVFFLIKKKIPKSEYSLAWFAFGNVVIFLATDIMGYFGNNIRMYHLYFIYEMIFVSWYFSRNLFKQFISLSYIFSGAFILIWFINLISWEPFNVFPSTSAVLEKVTIIFLCMVYLFRLAKSDRIMYFQKLPEFWVTTAFLISSTIEIFSVGSYKYMNAIINDPTGNTAWIIDVIGVFFKFVLLSVAFLCYKNNGKLSLSAT